jgi:hypothetical protein
MFSNYCFHFRSKALKKNLLFILCFLFMVSVKCYAFTGVGAAPAGFKASLNGFQNYDFSQAIFSYYPDSAGNYCRTMFYCNPDYLQYYDDSLQNIPNCIVNDMWGANDWCSHEKITFVGQLAGNDVDGNYFGYISTWGIVKYVHLNSNQIQPNYIYDSVLLWHAPNLSPNMAPNLSSIISFVAGCLVSISFVFGVFGGKI